jgi:hypothetical protein
VKRSSTRKGRRTLEGASWRVAPVVGDVLSRDVLARSYSSCRNLRVATRVSRLKCSRCPSSWRPLVMARWVLAKTIRPSAPATIFGKLLAPSRREATAHGVQHEPEVKDAEGRRSRLETRSITFSSTRTVSRTEIPLRTALGSPPKKRAGPAGAPGKAGPTRQYLGFAGKQDPSIVRQCVSLLV